MQSFRIRFRGGLWRESPGLLMDGGYLTVEMEHHRTSHGLRRPQPEGGEASENGAREEKIQIYRRFNTSTWIVSFPGYSGGAAAVPSKMGSSPIG